MELYDVKGYEGLYKINKNGDVYAVKRKIYMKQTINYAGYYFINLWKNSKRKKNMIHRLLALHFIDNPNNYPQVDHIDNNRQNNNLDNLRWITHSGNSRNRILKNKTGFAGVDLKPSGRFRAAISIDKKQICLGTYDTAEEAYSVYLKKYNEFMSIF